MARQNTEFAIDQGPSKLDLMLSLFDTDMGARTVMFRIDTTDISYKTPGCGRYDISIVSARRRHPSGKIWDIEGIVQSPRHAGERVSIYYLSDTREGRMRFEDKFRTHGVMETPDDSRKAKALMIIVQKMIARYQNSHSGNLDEEIFKLFEKAKRVHRAEEHNSLTEAIENI